MVAMAKPGIKRHRDPALNTLAQVQDQMEYSKHEDQFTISGLNPDELKRVRGALAEVGATHQLVESDHMVRVPKGATALVHKLTREGFNFSGRDDVASPADMKEAMETVRPFRDRMAYDEKRDELVIKNLEQRDFHPVQMALEVLGAGGQITLNDRATRVTQGAAALARKLTEANFSFDGQDKVPAVPEPTRDPSADQRKAAALETLKPHRIKYDTARDELVVSGVRPGQYHEVQTALTELGGSEQQTTSSAVRVLGGMSAVAEALMAAKIPFDGKGELLAKASGR